MKTNYSSRCLGRSKKFIGPFKGGKRMDILSTKIKTEIDIETDL